MKKRKFGITTALVIMALAGAGLQANEISDEDKELLEMLNLMDELDFQDAISAADKCTVKREFDCAKENIEKAKKFVWKEDDRKELEFAEKKLDKEIKLAKLAEEQRAIEKEMQSAKARFEERQREAARQRKIEERKAKEERENQRLAGLAIGFVAGSVAAYNGVDTQTSADLMDSVSAGAYGIMSGDPAALQEFDNKMAALNQRLEKKKAQQDAIFQENLRRQQEMAHKEAADRRERERQQALTNERARQLTAQQEKTRQATDQQVLNRQNADQQEKARTTTAQQEKARQDAAARKAAIAKEQREQYIAAQQDNVQRAAMAQQQNRRQSLLTENSSHQLSTKATTNIATPLGTSSIENNKQCTYETVSGRMTPSGEVTKTPFRGPYAGGLGETKAEAKADLEDTLRRLCYFFTDSPDFSLSNTDCELGQFRYSCSSNYTCTSKYKECDYKAGSAAQN